MYIECQLKNAQNVYLHIQSALSGILAYHFRAAYEINKDGGIAKYYT